jgi:DNA-binding beta-propeller fold protein YncE
VIRKILPNSTVCTIVGSPGQKGFADGKGSSARFNEPHGIVFDEKAGILYVADSENHRIRAVSRDGRVTTVAGTGQAASTDGPAASASFNSPWALCLCPLTGDLIVGDYRSEKIRRVRMERKAGGPAVATTVTTIAGSRSVGFKDGPALQAQFSSIWGLAVCPISGNIVIGENDNHRIRVLTPQGNVTTLAGNGTGSSTNGVGTAATFYYPAGVCVDKVGTIFVVEGSGYVRKITPQGAVTTLLDASSKPIKLNNLIGIILADFEGSSLIVVECNSGHKVSRISPL